MEEEFFQIPCQTIAFPSRYAIDSTRIPSPCQSTRIRAISIPSALGGLIPYISPIISSLITLYCFLFFLMPVAACFSFPMTRASPWNTWCSPNHATPR